MRWWCRETQARCGALAAHAGVRDVARELAQRNFAAFDGDAFDAIINNASGCGSMLKEYPLLFPADPEARGAGQEVLGQGSGDATSISRNLD